jgi:hypothetical protein
VAPYAHYFPGVPQNQIYAVNINNAANWQNAVQRIGSAKDTTYKAFVLVINGDFGVAPCDYGDFTFLESERLLPSGFIDKIYGINPVSILITGKGRMYLTSPGTIINIDHSQHLIIDGDVTLQGWATGNVGTSVISLSTGYRDGPRTKVELRKGTITAANLYGVSVSIGGLFVMSGGTISNNGGIGVYLHGGGFTMTGGTISNNGNSGVSIYMGGFTMTGGYIYGNTAEQGGGIFVHAVGELNISGGTIYGNNADAPYRNTATKGNGMGHAVYTYYPKHSSNPVEASFYRDISIGPTEKITLEYEENTTYFKYMPTRSGQTANGWTRK